ncbi:hypothetical protein GCM10007907_20790 [Chitinimonas prasina]|uniref:HTH cro/C1-type domain-containing protein n=1 Tax=Chitinimonas prasina TaxID=1434937 RepID=A0ABQ5YK11_9NEIS|nr:helix-turn-helix transcriptional regulator [Chitinimonas prasina]GLR13289.1 hypothetical protein GCM10007907_20790 [Chitinimonas prasina]
MTDFAERLRSERERLGLTQKDLADRVGITANAYGAYERGRAEPSVEALSTLASMGFDLSFLVLGARTDKRPALSAQPERTPEADSLGLRLAMECSRLGILDLQMSEAVGVSLRTFNNWILGTAEPNAAQLRAIDATGVDVLFVLTGKRGLVEEAGYSAVSIPDELGSLVEAWLHLHHVRPLDAQAVQVLADLTKLMNPIHMLAQHQKPALSPVPATNPRRAAADTAIDDMVNENLLSAIDQAQAAEVKRPRAPTKSRTKTGG